MPVFSPKPYFRAQSWIIRCPSAFAFSPSLKKKMSEETLSASVMLIVP